MRVLTLEETTSIAVTLALPGRRGMEELRLDDELVRMGCPPVPDDMKRRVLREALHVRDMKESGDSF